MCQCANVRMCECANVRITNVLMCNLLKAKDSINIYTAFFSWKS